MTHHRRMTYLWLGLALGLATIVPPGPISLTLVGIASRRGRLVGLQGAAGVAAGDVTAAGAAFAVVAAGTALPAGAFAAARVVATVVLGGFGLAMLAMPGQCGEVLDRIEHPGRTLFALTSLAPHAFASWLAIFAAMPFAESPHLLARFGLGMVLASALWHPFIGAVSAAAGTRATGLAHARLTRAGGLVMIAMGAGALASA